MTTTLDQLDSRVLRRVDCYGQRFMKPGEYRYTLCPAGVGDVVDDAPFVVEVTADEDAKGPDDATREDRRIGQATVVVRHDGRRFVAEPAHVRVRVGDMVLWNGPDDRPFTVRGAKEFFASDRLLNESGYSHVFTVPGEFAWGDAYGSALHGTVRVSMPEVRTAKALDAWRARLASGHAVVVADGRAEPAELDVVVGQTVFFVVTNGPGVSITDTALLDEKGRPGTKDDDKDDGKHDDKDDGKGRHQGYDTGHA